ncbi:zinc-dependent metalloprotease family protein [Enterovibrio calviensis]|uniref:zinc-dependent metalloprotease family protein n=1 Tax=Enterovibrio calviensis TaxID=91359 RepID=UPI003735B658
MNSKHLKKYTNLAGGLSLAFLSASVMAGNYTPKDIPDGQLPSNDPNIVFTTYNANWVSEIKLPIAPKDKTSVTLASKASLQSFVSHNTLDFETVYLYTNDSVTLSYDASTQAWNMNMEVQTPNMVGDTIQNDEGQRFVRYHMHNSNWTQAVKLPQNVNQLQGIVITSDATWTSRIDTAGLGTQSSAQIRTKDKYVLVYNKQYRKWFFKSMPERFINARDISGGVVPTPHSPLTVVQFANANYIGNLSLPVSGNEGDTVVIRSNADWNATIMNTRTDMSVPQSLRKGQEYVFVYRGDRRYWSLYQSPEVRLNARDLPNGVLNITTPNTHVYFSNANWAGNLKLPVSSEGTRVHVKTDAAWSFVVSGHGMASNRLYRGEWATFAVNSSGSWERETVTIDLLAYYSHRNVQKIGEATSRSRLVEGFEKTNEALINSVANFRFRMVRLEKFQTPDSWLTLGDALRALRTDSVAQQRRDALKADAIYYEGTESGCGLAWVKSSRFNMVATGSLNCGTNVMRHELGHNMGLNHGVLTPDVARTIAVGYSAERTVMGGNAIPYFSTPEKLSPTTKLPLGFENQIDGVKAMNGFSKQVAGYN